METKKKKLDKRTRKAIVLSIFVIPLGSIAGFIVGLPFGLLVWMFSGSFETGGIVTAQLGMVVLCGCIIYTIYYWCKRYINAGDD